MICNLERKDETTVVLSEKLLLTFQIEIQEKQLIKFYLNISFCAFYAFIPHVADKNPPSFSYSVSNRKGTVIHNLLQEVPSDISLAFLFQQLLQI